MGAMSSTAFSRIIRLGEGIKASGRINEAATRGGRALGHLPRQEKKRGVKRARLIATEACRARPMARSFAPASHEVGLELEVIDRGTEAEIAAAGCTPY